MNKSAFPLLGIASHISDDTLVCIDEPEVCLHPEWQEKYMEKLISTFKDFNGCHFLIATHSPQIVANLTSNNCFVIDMEKGTTVAAEALTHRSVDFQLANVFNAPGFKNEYLSRELIASLAALSSEISPAKDLLQRCKNLLKLRPTLRPDDPLNSLMEMLSSAINEVDGL